MTAESTTVLTAAGRKRSCRQTHNAVDCDVRNRKRSRPTEEADEIRPSASNCNLVRRDGVPTLLDLAARVTAAHVAFQRIEEGCAQHIPEPVQSRVLFWSFPRNEDRIQMYSSSPGSSVDDDWCAAAAEMHREAALRSRDAGESNAFVEGERLLEAGLVQNALQIGFHLSGTVGSTETVAGEKRKYTVSVTFDRCKITEVKCCCDNRDIHWCKHVVALSLFRIRYPDAVCLRLPISETLYRMDRNQLQKLIQHLITEYHTLVLPATQRLADDIMQPKSEINTAKGAPDPTAGPNADTAHSWYLDEEHVRSLVRAYLAQNTGCEPVQKLFAKVREMLRRRDENGPHLLQLLTEQFLEYKHPWTGTQLRPATANVGEQLQAIWDQIGALWVSIVLNPYMEASVKREHVEALQRWTALPDCPSEVPQNIHNSNQIENGAQSSSGDSYPFIGRTNAENASLRRTVFSRALDATRVGWLDAHLLNIIDGSYENTDCATLIASQDNFTENGQAIWAEHIPTACARVESLRAFGHGYEAHRLAVAIASAIVHAQTNGDQPIANRSAGLVEPEGWIGHPLDPINHLFGTLINAGSSQENDESLKPLAVEMALVALTQRRQRSSTAYGRCKALRQEQALISRLKTIACGKETIAVVRRQALRLINGNWSGLLNNSLPRPSPPIATLHTVVALLFETLMAVDEPTLAYDVGLAALKSTTVDGDKVSSNGPYLPTVNHPVAWTPASIDHGEQQQSELARIMILASKGNVANIRLILAVVCDHIRSSPAVYRLAHEIHQAAQTADDNDKPNLLHAALELGLQVLRMTLDSPSWWPRRELIRWLVNCASTLSLCALLSIIHNWQQLFVPAEVCGDISALLPGCGSLAQMVLIDMDTIAAQLKLNADERNELNTAMHQVVLHCTAKDPLNCALHALVLCQHDSSMFEQCYAVIATHCCAVLPPQELFGIAHFMEGRQHVHKAFDIAVQALKRTFLGYGEETSPLAQEVYYTCWLSDVIEKQQPSNVPPFPSSERPLTTVLEIVVNNIRCTTVLTAIVRGIALEAAGLSRSWFERQMKYEKLGNDYYGVPAEVLPSIRMRFDEAPLQALLEAALCSYKMTAESRLHHISPRHYGEFLDFLDKAHHTYRLAEDGESRFRQLLIAMRHRFKGKKKLMVQIAERFHMCS